MTDLALTVVLAAVLVYLIERLRPLAVRWLLLVEERAKGTPGKSVELPADLRMQVNLESEQWAREQTEKRFLELYHDYGGSWDRVRAILTGAEFRGDGAPA